MKKITFDGRGLFAVKKIDAILMAIIAVLIIAIFAPLLWK